MLFMGFLSVPFTSFFQKISVLNNMNRCPWNSIHHQFLSSRSFNLNTEPIYQSNTTASWICRRPLLRLTLGSCAIRNCSIWALLIVGFVFKPSVLSLLRLFLVSTFVAKFQKSYCNWDWETSVLRIWRFGFSCF